MSPDNDKNLGECVMQLVKPTFGRAALLWWTISWRSLVYGLSAGVLAGVVMGIIGVIAGWDEATLTHWSQMVGFAIAIPSCVYAAYSRLGKVCGDFRLVLVRADSMPDQAYKNAALPVPETVEPILSGHSKAA